MDGDFEKLVAHDKYRDILADYIAFRFHGRAPKSAIASIVTKSAKTGQALAELKKVWMTGAPADDAADAGYAAYEKARVAARVRDLQAFSGHISAVKIKRYLDIGCGNGVITAGIGQLLGLGKDAVIGADIAKWAGHEHAAEVSPNITFKTITPPHAIDVEPASVNVVTLFMVLHHVQDEILPAAMSEIVRVLAPGGLVIMREHDSPNAYIDSLINIEHALFETIIEGLSDVAEFQKHYYGCYKTKRDWVALFDAYGFIPVGAPVGGSTGTRAFMMAFRRRAGAETIDTKTAPELLATTRRLGIPVVGGSLSGDQLKRAIVAGRRAPA